MTVFMSVGHKGSIRLLNNLDQEKLLNISVQLLAFQHKFRLRSGNLLSLPRSYVVFSVSPTKRLESTFTKDHNRFEISQ
jgi:hypothetical protein